MKEKKRSNQELEELDLELQSLPEEKGYRAGTKPRKKGTRLEAERAGQQKAAGAGSARPKNTGDGNARPQNAGTGSARPKSTGNSSVRPKGTENGSVRSKSAGAGNARKQKPAAGQADPDKGRKKKNAGKKKTNKEFARVTYIFVTLFLVMIGYMVYFNVVKSKEVINSPYNIRQDLMAERVIRGDIVDCNGAVLAETVTDDQGNETRNYPYGEVFAHVVGYTDEGKSGLESSQNFNLLTSNAFFLEQLANEFKDEKNTGDTIVTTLDADLQQTAYNALGNNKGAVVVIEASTGKILAMVSKPSFDPNYVTENWEVLNTDEDSVLLNRATSGQYAPGSIFKIVTTLEYMRENLNYADYGYYCEGEIAYDGTVIPCYGHTAHGQESLADSVAYSCNASFANIGLQLDRAKWRETARDLLFDSKLPGEVKYLESSFRLTEQDTDAEAMMTAMGQGTTQVSPYHMAMITAAIANGGKLMKPYLVDEITNYSGTTVKKYMPEKYRDLMTSDEAAQLREYMKGVVDYGTGAALSGASYTVAGKTGTAEVSTDGQMVHSWFIGFSNVDNPELAVSVVVEDADTASISGVSVAKQIFDAYYY